MKKVDTLILGAGAAGLMCAIEVARRGRRVLIIDHARKAGEKIRISGGGRCNFTNLDIQPDRFLSQNPRFALSALKRYTQWDFIDRVATAGIAYHEKTLGQLFCDGSSQQIIDMLLDDLAAAGGEIALNCSIENVSKDGNFIADLSIGQVRADSLVVATGGKSIPKMGATGIGYKLAEQFGLTLTETRPALVPLTFAHQVLAETAPLAGSSVFARVSCNNASFDEGFLFTHRGLSGPSILQISSYWRDGDKLDVDLHPSADLVAALKARRDTRGRVGLQASLTEFLPKSLAGLIVANSGLSGNLADQSDAKLSALGALIHNWQVSPVGSEGYRKAEVTLGGVDTDMLDARTMQAKSVDGLYFIGEVVDVTGWLGGYNFQWAWSSGWAAGQVA